VLCLNECEAFFVWGGFQHGAAILIARKYVKLIVARRQIFEGLFKFREKYAKCPFKLLM
jgi:hypothetical protein